MALVEVNEYTALPRTVNAVAITAFHAVRDARNCWYARRGRQETSSRSPWQSDEEHWPPTAIRAPCRTPPRVKQNEISSSRPLHLRHLRHLFPHSIPLTARTIHRGEQLDGHLGTKACLRCTPAPDTVWWDTVAPRIQQRLKSRFENAMVSSKHFSSRPSLVP